MAINSDQSCSNVKELIAYARAHPGQVSMATSGIGSSAHLNAEMFKYMTGTFMLTVPYKGAGPSMIDTIAGRTHMVFGTALSMLSHVRDGKLKMLGITSGKRMTSLPDVPTIDEALNKEGGAVMRAPEILAMMKKTGSEPAYTSTAEFREVVVDAQDRAEKLIKDADLKFN